MKMNKVYRNMEYKVSNETTITGHPIVFESITDLGSHYEVIKRGALDGSDLSDISLLINHKFEDLPIARYRECGDSTMSIEVKEDGLHFETNLDPANPRAAEVLSCVKRGDIQKMSFGFLIDVENPACCYWLDNINDKPTLVITHISKVFDISIVTWPAYEATGVELKRAKEDDFEESDVFASYRNALEFLKLKTLAMYR